MPSLNTCRLRSDKSRSSLLHIGNVQRCKIELVKLYVQE